MSDNLYLFTVRAKEERPEGEIEQCGVVARSYEDAIDLVEEKHGHGVGWCADRFDRDPCRSQTERGFVYAAHAPKRRPKLSANDLYERALKLRDPDYDNWCLDRVFPRIDEGLIPSGVNKRVAARTIANPYIDGTRSHTLQTYWFDDQPFAVGQIAGRSPRDFSELFVTDPETYARAETYLLSLYEQEESTWYKVIDPDEKRRDLTVFYGHEAGVPREEALPVRDNSRIYSPYTKKWYWVLSDGTVTATTATEDWTGCDRSVRLDDSDERVGGHVLRVGRRWTSPVVAVVYVDKTSRDRARKPTWLLLHDENGNPHPWACVPAECAEVEFGDSVDAR